MRAAAAEAPNGIRQISSKKQTWESARPAVGQAAGRPTAKGTQNTGSLKRVHNGTVSAALEKSERAVVVADISIGQKSAPEKPKYHTNFEIKSFDQIMAEKRQKQKMSA